MITFARGRAAREGDHVARLARVPRHEVRRVDGARPRVGGTRGRARAYEWEAFHRLAALAEVGRFPGRELDRSEKPRGPDVRPSLSCHESATVRPIQLQVI